MIQARAIGGTSRNYEDRLMGTVVFAWGKAPELSVGELSQQEKKLQYATKQKLL